MSLCIDKSIDKALETLCKDISDIVKRVTNITIPISNIKLQKTSIVLSCEQIKKSVIFRKEGEIRQEIEKVLKIKIDKIL